MFRALSIIAAVAALAVSAAPVASAGPNSKTTGHSAGLAPDFGIYLSLRKAPPKPPGLGVTYFKGELVGIEPSLRKALPKPRGISGDVHHYGATRVTPKVHGAGYVANHTDGTVSVMFLHGDFSS